MSSALSSVGRNGASIDTRYSKDQLLDLYKAQRDTGVLAKNLADYFVADWNPHIESPSVNGAWGKRDDHKDTSTGPEVCWDHGGQVEPLGLMDMTDDEKEVCLPVCGLFNLSSCTDSIDIFRLGQLPIEATTYKCPERERGLWRSWAQDFSLLPTRKCEPLQRLVTGLSSAGS